MQHCCSNVTLILKVYMSPDSLQPSYCLWQREKLESSLKYIQEFFFTDFLQIPCI